MERVDVDAVVGSTGRPDGWVQRVRLDLRRTARAPQVARDTVAECLRAFRVDERCIEVVVLGTSELVTNAVLHGTPPSTLRLFTTDGLARVEVADANLLPLPAPGTSGRDGGGRGLLMIAELATRWGWGVIAGDKTVWFETVTELD